MRLFRAPYPLAERTMTSDDFESALGKFRSDLAAETLRRAIRDLETKFDPNQPRAPVGSADGGQWVDTGRGGGGGKIRRPLKVGPRPKAPPLARMVGFLASHPEAAPLAQAVGFPALAGGVALTRAIGDFDARTTGRVKTPFLKLQTPGLNLRVTDEVVGAGRRKPRTRKWRPGVGKTSINIENDCDELYYSDEIKCKTYSKMYGKDKSHKGSIYAQCMASAAERHATCTRFGIDAVSLPLFDGRSLK